jgi:hypothetical protein
MPKPDTEGRYEILKLHLRNKEVRVCARVCVCVRVCVCACVCVCVPQAAPVQQGGACVYVCLCV